jgi:hypothetical protein
MTLTYKVEVSNVILFREGAVKAHLESGQLTANLLHSSMPPLIGLFVRNSCTCSRIGQMLMVGYGNHGEWNIPGMVSTSGYSDPKLLLGLFCHKLLAESIEMR